MFTGRFLAVLTASLVSCAITTMGIHVIAKHEQWAQANTPYFISFAAGMLISVTFLHLIPKACSMSEAPYSFFLAGFMGLYASNRLIKAHAFQESKDIDRTLGMGIVAEAFEDYVDTPLHRAVDALQEDLD